MNKLKVEQFCIYAIKLCCFILYFITSFTYTHTWNCINTRRWDSAATRISYCIANKLRSDIRNSNSIYNSCGRCFAIFFLFFSNLHQLQILSLSFVHFISFIPAHYKTKWNKGNEKFQRKKKGNETSQNLTHTDFLFGRMLPAWH